MLKKGWVTKRKEGRGFGWVHRKGERDEHDSAGYDVSWSDGVQSHRNHRSHDCRDDDDEDDEWGWEVEGTWTAGLVTQWSCECKSCEQWWMASVGRNVLYFIVIDVIGIAGPVSVSAVLLSSGMAREGPSGTAPSSSSRWRSRSPWRSAGGSAPQARQSCRWRRLCLSIAAGSKAKAR